MNCDNYYHNYNFIWLVFMKIARSGFKLFMLFGLCCGIYIAIPYAVTMVGQGRSMPLDQGLLLFGPGFIKSYIRQ